MGSFLFPGDSLFCSLLKPRENTGVLLSRQVCLSYERAQKLSCLRVPLSSRLCLYSFCFQIRRRIVKRGRRDRDAFPEKNPWHVFICNICQEECLITHKSQMFSFQLHHMEVFLNECPHKFRQADTVQIACTHIHTLRPAMLGSAATEGPCSLGGGTAFSTSHISGTRTVPSLCVCFALAFRDPLHTPTFLQGEVWLIVPSIFSPFIDFLPF